MPRGVAQEQPLLVDQPTLVVGLGRIFEQPAHRLRLEDIEKRLISRAAGDVAEHRVCLIGDGGGLAKARQRGRHLH